MDPICQRATVHCESSSWEPLCSVLAGTCLGAPSWKVKVSTSLQRPLPEKLNVVPAGEKNSKCHRPISQIRQEAEVGTGANK